MSSPSSTPEETAPGSQGVVPKDRWRATNVLALALFVGVLGLMEAGWRLIGLVPSVEDNMDLWSYERDQVRPLFGKPLILLGASRLQTETDMGVLRERLPEYHTAQLSVNGKTPLATLKDLAADTRLHDGAILVEVSEHALEKASWDEQEGWPRYYHERATFMGKLEAHVSALAEAHLCIFSPVTSLMNLAKGESVLKRRYRTCTADRACQTDYSLVDAEKAKKTRIERLTAWYNGRTEPSPDKWLQQALEVRPLLKKLADRRVRVAFVRAPSTGEHWTIDAEHYPKDKYWDRLHAKLPKQTIHFEDHPGMRPVRGPGRLAPRHEGHGALHRVPRRRDGGHRPRPLDDALPLLRPEGARGRASRLRLRVTRSGRAGGVTLRTRSTGSPAAATS